MNTFQAKQKRLFDVSVSTVGLLALSPLLLVLIPLARWSTGMSGIFKQERVGQHGEIFTVYKLRTMKSVGGSTVTTANDTRITKLGAWLRKSKLDELPQLYNVIVGDMSFVGPRPDVPGFADHLCGCARDVMSLRPGITGPATIKYGNEEMLLADVKDPEAFNREVIFPDKVRLNLDYLDNWSLIQDVRYILVTCRILKIPDHLIVLSIDKPNQTL